jgi:ankyrin repeat protein
VLTLLDAGVSPMAPDSMGRLPLPLAIAMHRELIAEELLRAGADPTRAGADSLTAWDVAMQDGTAAMIELLLVHTARDAGAGPTTMRWFAGVRGDEQAPPSWDEVLSGELLSLGLMYAAHHDRADLIATMRRGREIPNRTGYHALAIAARWDHPAAVRALLAIDVHPDLESQGAIRATPLYWAATAGDLASARLLLAAGAEPDRAVQGGRRASDVARARNDSAMVALLARRVRD